MGLRPGALFNLVLCKGTVRFLGPGNIVSVYVELCNLGGRN